MKVVVFGANGQSGSEIVKFLLGAGHDVVAAVRRPETMKLVPEVQVAKIDLNNYCSIVQAVRGCDVLISALGHGGLKASAQPTTLYSDSTRAFLKAMSDVGCPRIIVLSSGGVVEDDAAPAFYTKLIRRYLVNTYLDMVRMETILEESNVDWTSVRLTFLKSGPTKPLRVRDDRLGGGKFEIHFQDVGLFVAKEVLAREWVRKHPVLGYE